MSRVSSQAPGARLPPLGSLAGPRMASPAEAGEPPREAPDPGSRSLATLAKSFQKAEALLRHCVNPSLWRLFPHSAGESAYDSEEEDSPAGLAHLAQVERSFVGLSRCLCVQENPRTETFQGHVRPAASEAAHGATAFSYHPARSCVARRCTTLHALLQHRHHLRLARHFGRRLKAASDFVCRLRAEGRRLPPLPEGQPDPPCSRRLRGLCEELHTHTTHWAGLHQHVRSDPWLHPLLVQRPEVLQHMKQSLLMLALHAICLLEGYVEASLRSLAQCATGSLPTQLLDFFRAVDFYNRVVGNQALRQALAELRPKPEAKAGGWLPPGSSSHTFPPERVLALLTAERGRLAARQLYRLLQGQLAGRPDSLPWEGPEESWLLGGHSQAPQGAKDPASLAAELQAFCQQEEDALLCLMRELVASTDSPWHRVLKRPHQEKPSGCPASPETPGAPSDSACLPGWKSVRWLDASFTEVAAGLYAQYCPLLWRAAASTFACKLELLPHLAQSPKAAGAVLGQQLICALAQGRVPQESTKALRALGLHLLLRDVLCHWDRGFCHALGSSLTDKCMARLGPQDAGAPCSQTAQALQRLYQPLAFSLRCLDGPPSRNTGDQVLLASLHWKLLSLSVATSHASCYWVMSKAHQYLASWSLGPLLLVTQGDLQVLKTESDKMWSLVGEAFPEEGERKQNLLISSQEQKLSWQIHAMATSIHLFTEDVLNLFFLDCKRMSSEIFGQTMPLGKHWRLALRAGIAVGQVGADKGGCPLNEPSGQAVGCKVMKESHATGVAPVHHHG